MIFTTDLFEKREPMKKTKGQNSSQKSHSKEPIALIGMGCRFPGGAKKDIIIEISTDGAPCSWYSKCSYPNTYTIDTE